MPMVWFYDLVGFPPHLNPLHLCGGEEVKFLLFDFISRAEECFGSLLRKCSPELLNIADPIMGLCAPGSKSTL